MRLWKILIDVVISVQLVQPLMLLKMIGLERPLVPLTDELWLQARHSVGDFDQPFSRVLFALRKHDSAWVFVLQDEVDIWSILSSARRLEELVGQVLIDSIS
jgi:hypothetical protein